MTRLLSCMFVLLALACETSAADRPNVLLCVADDWGWPHAGAYGDGVVRTPTFDRLAREGLLFEHAFVAAPSCTPSRNAMLTGQQFYRLGQGANLQATLDAVHPNFMRLMEQAGYRIGHWRKAWGPGAFEPGGYAQHPCGPPSEFAAFLKQRAKDQPFCFWFGTSDPHRPYEPGSGAKGGVDVSKIRVPTFLPDHETVRSDIADYYHEVQRWDRDVAKAIELLKASGELDNTIIVMTGDNGMPFPRCKGNLYDFGSRAPLAIRWGKGIAAPGRRIGSFVSLTDLAPTFLTAAGIEVPRVMTGRSLSPLFGGESNEPVATERDRVVFGRERHAAAQGMPSLEGYPSRALRTDRYLYIMNLEADRWPAGVPEGATHPIGRHADCDDGPTKDLILARRDEEQYRPMYSLCFARRPAEELYDVHADPDQVHNLAAEPAHRETLVQVREQLTRDLRETGDPRFTGGPVKFDAYPYRDERIHRRIKLWREERSARDTAQPRPETGPLSNP